MLRVRAWVRISVKVRISFSVGVRVKGRLGLGLRLVKVRVNPLGRAQSEHILTDTNLCHHVHVLLPLTSTRIWTYVREDTQNFNSFRYLEAKGTCVPLRKLVTIQVVKWPSFYLRLIVLSMN